MKKQKPKYSGQIRKPRRRMKRLTSMVFEAASSRQSCLPMRNPLRTKKRSTPLQPYRTSIEAVTAVFCPRRSTYRPRVCTRITSSTASARRTSRAGTCPRGGWARSRSGSSTNRSSSDCRAGAAAAAGAVMIDGASPYPRATRVTRLFGGVVALVRSSPEVARRCPKTCSGRPRSPETSPSRRTPRSSRSRRTSSTRRSCSPSGTAGSTTTSASIRGFLARTRSPSSGWTVRCSTASRTT